jgi:prephenate dehydratase
MSPRRIDPVFLPDNPPMTLTSVVFTTRSIPAALYKCIGGFATQGVNIIKLESYVPFFKDKSASFYAEIEGNPRDVNVKQAMDELGYYTTSTHILGVYAASPYRNER